MDTESITWGGLGFAISLLVLGLGFLKFGVSHFATKESVDRLWSDISKCGTRSEIDRLWAEIEKRASREDVARLERELERQRTRIHNIPGEVLSRLDRRDYPSGRTPGRDGDGQ